MKVIGWKQEDQRIVRVRCSQDCRYVNMLCQNECMYDSKVEKMCQNFSDEDFI